MKATTQREQRLIDALQSIVRETMDYPPLPPISGDSYLPSTLIDFAQAALGEYGARVVTQSADFVEVAG
jgi:hypothetical protein